LASCESQESPGYMEDLHHSAARVAVANIVLKTRTLLVSVALVTGVNLSGSLVSSRCQRASRWLGCSEGAGIRGGPVMSRVHIGEIGLKERVSKSALGSPSGK